MRHVSLIALLFTVGCGGSSPSSPSKTPPPTTLPATTRIISLSGPVIFGDVQIGTSKTASLTMRNAGNSTLTWSGIGGGFAETSLAPPTSGTIPPGASTTLVFSFAPSTLGARSASLIVNGDYTDGNGVTTMSGNGIAAPPPSAQGAWTGRASATTCRQSGPLGGTDYCHDNANIFGPMTMTFVQSATGAVTGSVSFIDYKAPVSGSLNGTRLQVNGTGSAGFLDYEFTNWNTTIVGNGMTGGFTFRFSAKNPGGFVEWTMALSNMTRTAP